MHNPLRSLGNPWQSPPALQPPPPPCFLSHSSFFLLVTFYAHRFSAKLDRKILSRCITSHTNRCTSSVDSFNSTYLSAPTRSFLSCACRIPYSRSTTSLAPPLGQLDLHYLEYKSPKFEPSLSFSESSFPPINNFRFPPFSHSPLHQYPHRVTTTLLHTMVSLLDPHNPRHALPRPPQLLISLSQTNPLSFTLAQSNPYTTGNTAQTTTGNPTTAQGGAAPMDAYAFLPILSSVPSPAFCPASLSLAQCHRTPRGRSGVANCCADPPSPPPVVSTKASTWFSASLARAGTGRRRRRSVTA
jgi:hypothetical protein